MMARTQITLEPEMQRRARQKAADLGISLAEYMRQLVMRDIGGSRATSSPTALFDLGTSSGADMARKKDTMIAEAFRSRRARPRRYKVPA